MNETEPTADNKNITIIYIESKEYSVFADENMLKAIMRNLVSNAIKFTNNGGTINISIRQFEELKTKSANENFQIGELPMGKLSNCQIISVSDNGIGITHEHLKRLFDISQTQTTKGTDNEVGTGLGLMICKEFVEKHGGKIWVESEEGKGSKFIFTLPAST